MQRSELASGIRVLTERVPGQRSASIGAWVATGSRHEPAELNGVTHFLEHLLFKGTPTRTALAIAQDVDAIGGELNAFTSRELTCVHARTLGADVPMAVDTIADMLRNATIADDDVEAERSVVLEEISMHEDTPDDIVYDVFCETLWPEHPLGRRVQGVVPTVSAMTPATIRDYHRARYVPSSIVISAAGDVHHDSIVEQVAAAFGETSARGADVPLAPPTPVAMLAVEQRDIEQTHLVYGTIGIPRSDERRWAVAVLNVALGGGMSSRLFQEIRERRGLAYSVSSGHQAYVDSGSFSIYAGCSPDNTSEVLRLVREQVDAVLSDGLSEQEVERAIGHLRGSLAISMDDPGVVMSHIGKSELLLGEVLEVEEMMRRIQTVTVEQVHTAARDVLAGGPWSLVVLGARPVGDVSGYVGEAA